jgi:starch synthase
MIGKVKFDNIDDSKIKILEKPTYNNLMKIAIDNSDALIRGSNELSKELDEYLDASEKPVLNYFPIEDFAEHYTEFYNTQVLDQ